MRGGWYADVDVVGELVVVFVVRFVPVVGRGVMGSGVYKRACRVDVMRGTVVVALDGEASYLGVFLLFGTVDEIRVSQYGMYGCCAVSGDVEPMQKKQSCLKSLFFFPPLQKHFLALLNTGSENEILSKRM